MVDVVVNHNAYWGSPSSIDYSKFTPFNDEKYYHPYCAINYNDENNAVSLQMRFRFAQTTDLISDEHGAVLGRRYHCSTT